MITTINNKHNKLNVPIKLLSFLNDFTKLQTNYTYTHNKSVREKICHIFQFSHNTLCINNIKTGR